MVQRNGKVTALNENYVKEENLKQQRVVRRKKGLIRRLTAFGVLVVIIFTVMISTITSQSAVIAEKKEERQKAVERLQEVTKEKSQLKEEVNRLQDPEYIGEVARRDHSMSKPGETIFKVSED
ncbi:septum formation initiator family protein [Alkalihalobacillus sp. AL-G]|uniref:FtsB family cell division protein n=1 Tax=Alkalihalobacillus sp. AL-G TaxID=2926399 RepID=UPI00272AACD0|nr:septum formation initiator family protein [Alkalihalobacillus sp. AL-G]WLD93473.1 septum formation initiator family protein [Alkalihalobacillus sp. AL-G]